MLLSFFQVMINYTMELLPSKSYLLTYTFRGEKDGVKRCWLQGKEASSARWYLSSPFLSLLPESGFSVLFPKETKQAKCPSPSPQPAVHYSNLQHGRGRTHNYFNFSLLPFKGWGKGKFQRMGPFHSYCFRWGVAEAFFSWFTISITVSYFPACPSFTLVASSL